MPWKRKAEKDASDSSSGVSSAKYPKGDSSSSASSSINLDSAKRLDATFYQKPCKELARALLGKKLVRKLESGELVAGDIVETEAYLGGDDKASHSFGGKKTGKNEAMFMEPGTVYAYNIYGVMTCINISSQGEGAAVLIRAIDATHGLDSIRQSRGVKRPDKGLGLPEKDLGSGPSKLTQALSVSKAEFNKQDITGCDSLWLQDGFEVAETDVVVSTRIGIDSAGDWAKKPLRYYVRGNKSVSVRDKDAEKVNGEISSPEVKSTSSSGTSTSSLGTQDTKATSSSDIAETKVAKPVARQKQASQSTKNVDPKLRLPATFYQKPCKDLARALLGKKLVRELESGELVAGDIVETEAYLGGDDKASHSFGGKKTGKNEAMFMEPGTVYVYNIYGVMTCINISSQGEGAAVLIRAIDATHGLDLIRQSRGVKRPDKGLGLPEKDLGSGPSKLTQALSVSKAEFNKQDITGCDSLWLQDGFEVAETDVVVSTRIGIDSAGDWAKKPLRYYVRGNKSVSVRIKE